MELLVVVGEQVFGDVLKVFYLVTPAVSPTFGGNFPFARIVVVGDAGAGVGDCCGVCSAFGGDCDGCFVHSVSISPLRAFVKCLLKE